MNKSIIIKLALTSVAVATPVIGMNGVVAQNGSEAKNAEKLAKKAFGWAKKAEKHLAKGNVEKALHYSEMAVGADMQNLEYRALLARVYMKEGRFSSAERTLMDVMELGQTDARTVVSLALTRVAQGKVESAISLVDANQALLPASDYGLALALAGDTKRGINVLNDAIRADNATARTRQNLALAYALDGRWRDAQVMALQDMPQHLADQAIIEWARIARPGAYQDRIASLLKVTPTIDSGQPVQLALNAMAGEVNVAAAELPPVPQPPVRTAMTSVDPSVELAAIGPAPVDVPAAESLYQVVASVAAPVEEAPLIRAQAGPAKRAQAVPVLAAKVAAPKVSTAPSKSVKLALADTASPAPAPAPAPARKVNGTHLIQLGAYSSTGNAMTAWNKLSRQFGVLQGFGSASSTVVVNGKSLVRLAAMGFGNVSSANAVCKQIKAKGGDCVVKAVGGTSPVRMAAASPKAKVTVKSVRRIASR